MICTTNCTLTTARIDAKSKFNTIFFKKGIENAEICSIIVVWGITTMNNYEFLEKLGFSSNEAKVYGTLIKHKVLNGYEIAKLSGVARSLVYEVINRLVAKGAVIRIDGEPNFYKPIEYQDLIRSIKEENEKNIACAERELQQLATENADVDYVMNIVGEEKYVAKAKELIDSAQAEISLSIWRELFEVLRSNIENAISRGVKVYIFTFESILVEGATVYSYNINDVSTLFPYRRTTIIIDGGECLVGEEGDRNVYVHTRNHSVVSLATDEIVLNIFWNKLIEKENLLSKGCSGADFLQAIHNLAERYGITDEMTKNFLVYNFQKEKTGARSQGTYPPRKAVGRKKQQVLFDLLVYDFVAHLHNGRNRVYYIHSVSGEYSYRILRKKYGYGIRRGIIALFRHRFYFLSGNTAYYFLSSPCGQIRA